MGINFRALIFVFVMLEKEVHCKDASWVHFIKTYVENEGKPTILILSDICWDKSK